MAYTQIPDWWVPSPTWVTAATQATASGINTKVGLTCAAPKSGNIRKVHFATQTVTTGATLDVRVETISAGVPSGTLVSTNSNGSQVVLDAEDNTFFATTLTADAVVTGGQKIGIVISQPGASAGNIQFSAINNTIFTAGASSQYPIGLTHNATSWAFVSVVLCFAVEYDDGSIIPITGVWAPYTTLTGVTDPNNNFAIKFKFPIKVRVKGCWYICDQDGTSRVRLVTTAYHQANATGILATTADITSSDRAAGNTTIFMPTFDSRVELDADTYYRMTWQPVSGSGMDLSYRQSAAAVMAAHWQGAEFFRSTALNPTGDGDWTDSSTTIPTMGLLIDGIDASGGGGAGVSGTRIFTGF